ncbi:MAG: hypothetical protein CMH12_25530 [Maritimibacter sp.]|nr:hypothetical protein [Maritimibacter sp.]
MTDFSNLADEKKPSETPEARANETFRRIKQHQAAGRHDAAMVLLDDLLQEHPGNVRLQHYKGMNLILMGRKDEGRAIMEAALAMAPEDPLQLCDLASHLAENGELDKATEYFETAVEVAPDYAIARSNLGAALVLQEKFQPAIRHLERAIALDSSLIDAHTNLATAFMRTHQYDKAIDVLFRALAINPQAVGAHISLAGALLRRERYESAEHHARRALELAPNAPEAALHLGNALASSGKMEEAAEVLLKVARGPVMPLAALSRLIHLRKTTADSPEQALLASALRQEDKLTTEQKATVHFAAGKAFDDLGDYATAFAHFRKANDINKEIHPFDPVAAAERADRVLEFCSPDLMTRCAGGGLSETAPIFICGMPRSGTTLMDQMFSRHPKVQAGGELRSAVMSLARNRRLRDALEEKLPDAEINADDFSRLGEDYAASVHQEGITSEFHTDKMPANYQYIGLLALALPRAKFLVMRRHPLDNLLSNYMQHFGRNQPFSTDFAHLASVYASFDKAATHWASALPDRVREVHYEDVTADPEGQMREVLDFVGLDWTPDVLDYKSSLRQVNTASVSQVREPIYRRAVERWRRYGPALEPMARELRGFLTAEELAACGVTD